MWFTVKSNYGSISINTALFASISSIKGAVGVKLRLFNIELTADGEILDENKCLNDYKNLHLGGTLYVVPKSNFITIYVGPVLQMLESKIYIVPPYTKVEELKEIINHDNSFYMAQRGSLVKHLTLAHSLDALKGNKTLSDYGIKDGSALCYFLQ